MSNPTLASIFLGGNKSKEVNPQELFQSNIETNDNIETSPNIRGNHNTGGSCPHCKGGSCPHCGGG